ncbi:MAG: hypothetical protein K1X31_03360 [Gemmatimonadaceae bacterium]|nr:hypothetical protein [Gemmatimonadaceae bacterium]
MPPRPSQPTPADAPLRPRLVLGWSLFFVFAVLGLGLAFWRGPAVPVLLDLFRS